MQGRNALMHAPDLIGLYSLEMKIEFISFFCLKNLNFKMIMVSKQYDWPIKNSESGLCLQNLGVKEFYKIYS